MCPWEEVSSGSSYPAILATLSSFKTSPDFALLQSSFCQSRFHPHWTSLCVASMEATSHICLVICLQIEPYSLPHSHMSILHMLFLLPRMWFFVFVFCLLVLLKYNLHAIQLTVLKICNSVGLGIFTELCNPHHIQHQHAPNCVDHRPKEGNIMYIKWMFISMLQSPS